MPSLCKRHRLPPRARGARGALMKFSPRRHGVLRAFIRRPDYNAKRRHLFKVCPNETPTLGVLGFPTALAGDARSCATALVAFVPRSPRRSAFFLHTSFIKIEKFRYFSGGRQIYLTLLTWLLIQDKKNTRLNSIVSSPKQLLFKKTRLHWCEFIGYILDSHSFSTKNKSKLHFFSI